MKKTHEHAIIERMRLQEEIDKAKRQKRDSTENAQIEALKAQRIQEEARHEIEDLKSQLKDLLAKVEYQSRDTRQLQGKSITFFI